MLMLVAILVHRILGWGIYQFVIRKMQYNKNDLFGGF